MRSPTYGNRIYKVNQTSSGLLVEIYYEMSRTTCGKVGVIPSFCWHWDDSNPFRCSNEFHESELYTQEDLDALLEQQATQLHVANTL